MRGESRDPDRINRVGLGPLKLFLGKTPRAYGIKKGYGEAFANEPRDQILPVVSRRFDCDETIRRFSQQSAKPLVPGGFLSKRYRSLEHRPSFIHYCDSMSLRSNVDSSKSHPPYLLFALAGNLARCVRKGGRKAKIPLTPATVAALEAYLADRAGAGEWRQLSGPLLATATGGRLRQGHLWELVRRLARTAGIGAWEQLSPHSLRHSAITFALDAGASLRDVQDYAGHKDPRTTRRYDHSRDSLDRNAAYTVAAYLA